MNSFHSLNKQTILLVDDNLDILDYLEKHLQEEYTIVKAVNGKDALEKLKENLPDLIVSDILMPQMNGLELCKTIKTDPHLCHIPVILLTAQSMISQMQEGYAAEADDYITKPFDITLFKARVKNVLSMREKMKTVYGDSFSLKNLGIEQADEKSIFLNKYIEIVKENLSDPDFDVAIIYNSMGMSRPTFYRKVKNLTGLSPTELITHVRLEVASRLLLETTMSINDVALSVGFSSGSYFARNFRTVYGLSPTEYQKKSGESA
ncbi:MAG: response regulator [Tannerellaceae bacterium]|nr:response regulator [Tannerellaceae bacterium]